MSNTVNAALLALIAALGGAAFLGCTDPLPDQANVYKIESVHASPSDGFANVTATAVFKCAGQPPRIELKTDRLSVEDWTYFEKTSKGLKPVGVSENGLVYIDPQ